MYHARQVHVSEPITAKLPNHAAANWPEANFLISELFDIIVYVLSIGTTIKKYVIGIFLLLMFVIL